MGDSRIPADVNDAIYRVVHDYGAERLSRQTGTPVGTIYNKVNPHETSHHKPTLSDALIWTRITGDFRAAQAFCHALDGVFVPLATQQYATDLELLDLVLAKDVRQGHFADKLIAAVSDGKVTALEFKGLRHGTMDVVTAMLELLGRLEGMVRD